MIKSKSSSLPHYLTLKVIVLALMVTLVAGCAGPQALSLSYERYSKSFASASNQQLLLNLARLRNGHPPFFLQMGPATAQFTFSGGFNGSFSETEVNPPGLDITETIQRLLGLNFNSSEIPLFNFTPISGGAYGTILLKPIDGQVLLGLISQNLPASTLLRLVADEVSLDYPNGERFAFRNQYSPFQPARFAYFLRLVAVLELLQTDGLLTFNLDETGQVSLTLEGEALAAARGYGAADGRFRFETFQIRPERGAPTVRVKTRAFLGVLYVASGDALLFDNFDEDYLARLPESQQQPVLRIVANNAFTEPEAARVSYAGQNYVISDRAGSGRNRASFLVLQLIASQAALDPSQLPVQQLIQVR